MYELFEPIRSKTIFTEFSTDQAKARVQNKKLNVKLTKELASCLRLAGFFHNPYVDYIIL